MAQPLPGTLEALGSKSSATNSKKGRKEGGGRKKERRRTRKNERERNKEGRSNKRKKRTGDTVAMRGEGTCHKVLGLYQEAGRL